MSYGVIMLISVGRNSDGATYPQGVRFRQKNCEFSIILTARCIRVARTILWQGCPSHAGIVLKRLNVSSNLFHRRVATSF